MTTIIIIVVVALVFFVTVCVVTFMVWKREAEMRTDSIRAIENNLERLGDRLTAEMPPEEYETLQEGLHKESCRPASEQVQQAEPAAVRERPRRSRSADPFSWVRSEQGSQENAQPESRAAEVQQAEPYPAEAWQQQEPLQQPAGLQIGQEPPGTAEASESRGTSGMPEGTVPEMAQPPEVSGVPETPEFAEIELPDLSEDSDITDPPEMPEWQDPPEAGELPEVPDENESFMEIELPDLDLFSGLGTLDVDTEGETPAQPSKQFGRDVGRSGKKYTAEELEMLIKE